MTARPFRWSWRIGAPFGIGVYVHATFLLLVAWVAIAQVVAGRDAATVARSLGLLAAVFAVVVLHELGHALAARRYGIATRAITLLPIGGVASLERTPERPGQELVVALAGPAVNVALAGLLAVVLVARGTPIDVRDLSLLDADVVAGLFWVNVLMAAFNLLPAFPMDGGRVLRALLWMRLGPARATAAATAIGKLLAIGFGVIGAWHSPTLLVIALFVWLAADAEARLAGVRAALAGVPVARAMITHVPVLAPDQPLRAAAELIVSGHAQAFPVVADGAVRGLLTHDDVVRGIRASGPDAPVATAMHRDVGSISPADPLDGALGRLQGDDAGVLIVTDGGEAVGLLSLASLGEFLALRAALGAPAAPLHAGAA